MVTAQTPITVDGCLGIEEPEAKFGIYPNPVSNGTLYIQSSEVIVYIQIVDNTGRIVMDIPNPDQFEEKLDLFTFSDGIYQVITTTESTVHVDKIEVKK